MTCIDVGISDKGNFHKKWVYLFGRIVKIHARENSNNFKCFIQVEVGMLKTFSSIWNAEFLKFHKDKNVFSYSLKFDIMSEISNHLNSMPEIHAVNRLLMGFELLDPWNGA